MSDIKKLYEKTFSFDFNWTEYVFNKILVKDLAKIWEIQKNPEDMVWINEFVKSKAVSTLDIDDMTIEEYTDFIKLFISDLAQSQKEANQKK